MIRLGVVGYGRRIRHMLRVIDPRAEELRRECGDELSGATFYDDVAAMCDAGQVDGVLIGTRCSLHTPYAIEALERNLPLFLEKPVAISFEQLAALHAAAERSSSPVVVSFPLRVSAICET